MSIRQGKNGYQFPSLSQFDGFHCIFPCYGKLTGKSMHFTYYKVYPECKSNGKKAPILWVKYEYQFSRFSKYHEFCRIFPETNFSGFTHSMRFPTISHALGNWRANPCISLMSKYTTGWESNGKKHLFYGKSMGTNFPGIPHLMGFTML